MALAALLMPQARRRAWALGAGLLVFAAGLGARPGPQLLLPFLLVWAVFVGPRPRARTLVTCGLAVALGLLLPRALNRAYGTPESSFDVFSAYTLYGLTRNSNYTQALSDFGPELNSIGNEHEVSRFLYRKSLEQARREPAMLLKALWTNGTRFLIRLPRDLSAVISPRLLIDTPSFRFRRSPRETTWDDMTGGALLALSVAGIAYLFRTRDWDDRSFLLASSMGLTLSAPFVYGNAGSRTLAVGYPFLAAVVGLGLATIRAQAPRSRGRTETGTVAAALLLGLGLIVTGVVGPSVAHWLSPRPELTAVGQSAAEPLSAVVSLAESSTVRVVARQETRESKAHGVGDAMDRAAFLRWIEAAEVPPKAGFDQVRPPFAIISAFDYLNLRQRLLVAPPEMLDAPSGWLRVDLHPLEDNPYLAEVARWQTLR